MKKNTGAFVAARSFATTVVIISTLVGIGLSYMYSQDASAIDTSLKLHADMHNRMLSQAINLDLRTLFTDLKLVANHVEVRRFLTDRGSSHIKDIENEFLALSSISKAYDQVRLLDNEGMEIVRVNYNDGHPAAVPAHNLQDKSGRYYFRESLPLGPGEVYVSPFDLNVENGKIEQPLKPMIRVSTPVFDETGTRRGFVILNYFGRKIIDAIIAQLDRRMTLSMLLNSDGYWLLSPSKEQEWAFMYDDKQDIRFSTLHPDVWRIISSTRAGQFQGTDGLYTFNTIKVAPGIPDADHEAPSRQWKIVCLTPVSIAEASVGQVQQNYLTIYGTVLLLTLLVAFSRARFVHGRERSRRLLEAARQDAEEANRAKSDFLARMSHEIRTPMNAIIGLTHLSLKTPLSPKQNDYLSKISMSAHSLLGLINDILDFSKIEAGRLQVDKTDFLLDDVLNGILNMLGLQAEQKGLEFLLMVRSTVPNLLVGDPLRLGQVLLNLTGNAIKFTEHGEVVISARLVEETADTAFIRFSVKDTGIGIGQEQVDKLFQPFSQADGSITRRFGGTGLGLSISKRLVELMNGELTVTSEYGMGSEFSFTIPFELQARHSGQHLTYPNGIRGAKVLVVDDSAMSRKVLSGVLESFTFDVDTAYCGETALDMLHNCPPDNPYKLVLTDWRMPDIDGINLTRRIKRSKLLESQPKIILLTSYGQEDLRNRAEQAGVDGFMLKPFNRSILFDTIMEAMAQEGYRARSTVSEQNGNGVPANVAGANILLAEDNEINQQVAQEILEGADIRVTIASNGQEAVDMIAKGRFDAVLMDIQMPVMDGFQAVKTIREKGFEGLPVIAMTAHALVGDKEKSLLAGMNDHVTKPIDPDQLMETLSTWLPKDPRQSSRTESPEPEAKTSAFPKLTGINTEQALFRLRGNEILYKKLLTNFARDCKGLHRKLYSLISSGDYDEGGAVAHNMKGVAGNIGAEALHLALQNVEKAMRDRSDSVLIRLAEMTEEMSRVIDGIEATLPVYDRGENCEAIEVAPENALKLKQQAEKILSLLKQHDVEARSVFSAHEEEFASIVPGFTKRLKDRLDRFDFAGAREDVCFFLDCCDKENK